jgi:nucleotide-binding universal stress UspA family protein
MRSELDGLNIDTSLVANPNQKTGIVDFVRSSGADLVLLSAHGRSGLRDTPMGMTAERIVRDAPCSVVAVRPWGLK